MYTPVRGAWECGTHGADSLPLRCSTCFSNESGAQPSAAGTGTEHLPRAKDQTWPRGEDHGPSPMQNLHVSEMSSRTRVAQRPGATEPNHTRRRGSTNRKATFKATPKRVSSSGTSLLNAVPLAPKAFPQTVSRLTPQLGNSLLCSKGTLVHCWGDVSGCSHCGSQHRGSSIAI